jgi:hypothetical protein
MIHGIVPNVVDVGREFNLTPVAVQETLMREPVQRVMKARGIPIIFGSEKDGTGTTLSHEQLQCIAIMTDPTVRGGRIARLKKAGVSETKFKTWMNSHHFREAYTSLANSILENSLGDVNIGLVNAAEKGDVPAIKFFYEVTGRYNPQDRSVMDAMSILNAVVDIVQRHVVDPDVLKAMAAEISMLGANAIGVADTSRLRK